MVGIIVVGIIVVGFIVVGFIVVGIIVVGFIVVGIIDVGFDDGLMVGSIVGYLVYRDLSSFKGTSVSSISWI